MLVLVQKFERTACAAETFNNLLMQFLHIYALWTMFAAKSCWAILLHPTTHFDDHYKLRMRSNISWKNLQSFLLTDTITYKTDVQQILQK
jgi:hypothetical protein